MADITFESAIKTAIRHYFDNDDEELETSKLNKDRVYTKRYFEKFEEEILGERRAKQGKK